LRKCSSPRCPVRCLEGRLFHTAVACAGACAGGARRFFDVPRRQEGKNRRILVGPEPGAESLLKASVRLDPRIVEGHADLGVLYYRSGRYDEAVREFSRVVELDPTNSPAYTDLGWVLFRLGDVKESARSVAQALKFGPNNAWARLLAGSIMLTDPRTRDRGLAHLELAAAAIAPR